jgi:hypothetical protein
MKRIAINGSQSGSYLAKAFSAMTGMDYIVSTPYSIIAYQYKLDMDISKCQWPDSLVYCMGAFTKKIMIEQSYHDTFISDGGIFNELSWIKCRYPNIELIYERSMIDSFEKVVMNYASNEYDYIFHIESKDPPDDISLCLKQLYSQYHLKHHIIDGTNGEEALQRMLEYLQVKPVLSAKYALLKFADEILINEDPHENSN